MSKEGFEFNLLPSVFCVHIVSSQLKEIYEILKRSMCFNESAVLWNIIKNRAYLSLNNQDELRHFYGFAIVRMFKKQAGKF